ncbi:hypothetical protein KIN20_025502 [Parelaphostrongylus tenuis]|uniref:Uncharacterized protein n=1 Tax=Parelaphostrongylus tenuis TaxID=148309 RepID=A0AAD5N9D8_PARTN|nr:hypothetical protein KIN20_025502 [Parelaphostrongylus tenuis]
MGILSNMARPSTGPLLISMFAIISTTLVCGVIPAGQGDKRAFVVMLQMLAN